MTFVQGYDILKFAIHFCFALYAIHPIAIALIRKRCHIRSLPFSCSIMVQGDPKVADHTTFQVTLKLILFHIYREPSGRVLDSRPRGRGFETHRRYCVVVLEQDTFILA